MGEIGKLGVIVSTLQTGIAEDRGAAREAQAKNLRMVQIFTALAAISTIAGFILSHWPHK